MHIWVRVCVPHGSDSKESTCKAGDLGLTPELGRSPGGGRDNPLQSSSLAWRIPMDRGILQSMGSQRVGQD